MPILRNAERAIVDEQKVRDYLLNPLHVGVGTKLEYSPQRSATGVSITRV